MKEQLDTLRKIQETILARAECLVNNDSAHAEKLSGDIAALEETLEPRIRDLYRRLSSSKQIFMASLHNGNCSGCGMLVSSASVRMIRIGEHPVTCATCGRLLYEDKGAVASARKVEAPKDDDDITKEKGLIRFSCPELMFPNMKEKTPQAVIAKLAAAMEKHGYVSSGDELTRLAMEREALLSTRMEEEIAVPHVRGVEGGALAFAFAVLPGGVEWDDSGEKVKFVIFSAIPSIGSAFFMKLMSDLIAVIHRKASRTNLLEAKDSATLWKILSNATKRVIK